MAGSYCPSIWMYSILHGASTLTLPASHVPMLSHPGEVSEFIDRAARQLRDRQEEKSAAH
ncbi:hypothetical protein PV762_23435 [Mitsuaria sp. CC2]|jgi:hypothetical protein|uniref:hypothetical protein n=1 Tax=Mitsuaria sp. CC2 TaxID=3029186 RepID=UPI003B8E7B26